MANYRLSNTAKQDLIRIHQYGVKQFGLTQAENYLDTLFAYFDFISQRPFSFQSVDYIRKGYRRCVCGADSIFYRIADDKMVEVMTIIGMKDINSIFE